MNLEGVDIEEDLIFDIVKDWLNKCYPLRKLDPNFNYRIIKSALEDAIQKGISPMSLSKLTEKNRELHDMLRKNE